MKKKSTRWIKSSTPGLRNVGITLSTNIWCRGRATLKKKTPGKTRKPWINAQSYCPTFVLITPLSRTPEESFLLPLHMFHTPPRMLAIGEVPCEIYLIFSDFPFYPFLTQTPPFLSSSNPPYKQAE
jgi:hypothetical protein